MGSDRIFHLTLHSTIFLFEILLRRGKKLKRILNDERQNKWRNEMKQTPLRAIKKHFLECSGYEKKQVRECAIKDCVLFPYRKGTNPNRKGIIRKNGLSTTGFEKADSYVSAM